MKKLYILVLAAMLSACGNDVKKQQPAEPASAAQQASAAQVKSALCGQTMDITAEQLLGNLDKGLRSTGASPAIRDQKLTANNCGYLLEMAMDYGTIRLELNEQQKVRNLGVGYRNIAGNEGLTKNLNNAFAAVQTAVSVNGTAKSGETELGQKLFKTLGNLVVDHKNSGSGTQDIDFEGKRYTVGVEGPAVAIVVREIP